MTVGDDFNLTHVERARQRAAAARLVEAESVVDAALGVMVTEYRARAVDVTPEQERWLRDVACSVALAVLTQVPTPLRGNEGRYLTPQHLHSLVEAIRKLQALRAEESSS